MKTKVTFIELTAYEGVVPLATGYLHAYAANAEDIAAECSFEHYSKTARSDRFAMLEDLLEKESDVYALSCYVWNMNINRWLLDRLYEAHPNAQFILGGPQVMNHIRDYVSTGHENVVVCDGEGERSFLAYLRQIVSGDKNFDAVPGLSFWRDGEVVTVPKPDRIKDLNEIPSPYSAGIFEPGKYITAILETNRGCPFNCGFCAWGAATNDKVYSFDDDRVRDDIRWISEHQFLAVFIADANWGISPRDVEMSKYWVEQKNRNGHPYRLDMCAAKNRPDRMATICEILTEGGLVTTQTIALQSMDSDTLATVQRSNIRLSAYTSLQATLREKNINSNIEMIWPLPGETLDSFQRGIGELCQRRADVIVVYPQILLHDTPIDRQREVLGVQTARLASDVEEADIVVSTNWVTVSDYEDGVWFAYAMQMLYNQRGLYYLANYLDQNDLASFAELFASAADYLKSRPDAEIPRYLADSIKNFGNYDAFNSGTIAFMALHTHRAELNDLLAEFVRTQPWWHDENAQAAFELDMLVRPYIFSVPMQIADYEFTHIRYKEVGDHLALTLPPAAAELLARLSMTGPEYSAPEEVLVINQSDRKMPLSDQPGIFGNVAYCQGMVLCLREFIPVFQDRHLLPAAG